MGTSLGFDECVMSRVFCSVVQSHSLILKAPWAPLSLYLKQLSRRPSRQGQWQFLSFSVALSELTVSTTLADGERLLLGAVSVFPCLLMFFCWARFLLRGACQSLPTTVTPRGTVLFLAAVSQASSIRGPSVVPPRAWGGFH